MDSPYDEQRGDNVRLCVLACDETGRVVANTPRLFLGMLYLEQHRLAERVDALGGTWAAPYLVRLKPLVPKPEPEPVYKPYRWEDWTPEQQQEWMRVKEWRDTPRYQKKRMIVYARDDGRCRYCGEPIALEDAHVDHVVPRRHDGSDGLMNLVLACAPCNLRKGGRTPREAGMTIRQDFGWPIPEPPADTPAPQ